MNLKEVLSVVPSNIPILILRGRNIDGRDHVEITFYAYSLLVELMQQELNGFKPRINEIEVVHHVLIKSGPYQAIVMLVSFSETLLTEELLPRNPSYSSLLLLEDDATIVEELCGKPEVFLPLSSFLLQ